MRIIITIARVVVGANVRCWYSLYLWQEVMMNYIILPESSSVEPSGIRSIINVAIIPIPIGEEYLMLSVSPSMLIICLEVRLLRT